MRVYIGTTLTNRPRARHVCHALEAAGHDVPMKWWDHPTIIGAAGLSAISQRYEETIAGSDIVVILLPGKRGSHVELGMALALGKQVLLWDETDDTPDCAFYAHPLVFIVRDHLEDDGQLGELVTIAERLFHAGQMAVAL